eukprot:7377586-Prymnesium_polylepis.2
MRRLVVDDFHDAIDALADVLRAVKEAVAETLDHECLRHVWILHDLLDALGLCVRDHLAAARAAVAQIQCDARATQARLRARQPTEWRRNSLTSLNLRTGLGTQPSLARYVPHVAIALSVKQKTSLSAGCSANFFIPSSYERKSYRTRPPAWTPILPCSTRCAQTRVQGCGDSARIAALDRSSDDAPCSAHARGAAGRVPC